MRRLDEMGRGRTNALNLCERNGEDCVIFAYRGVIKVPYEVRSY
jgi:hypothetical protein